MERLGQERVTAGGSSTFRSFGADARGSVEVLEDTSGARAGGYRYDPYGAARLSGATPTDEANTEAAAANPFRFEGFYADDGLGTYDMQARPYSPDLSRFLTADEFEDAGADQALESDVLTQDRYAFAGGNPIGLVELDGHCPQAVRGDGPCPSKNPANRAPEDDPRTDRNKQIASQRPVEEPAPLTRRPTTYGATAGEQGLGDAPQTRFNETRQGATAAAARSQLRQTRQVNPDAPDYLAGPRPIRAGYDQDPSVLGDVFCFAVGCSVPDLALNALGPLKWAGKGGSVVRRVVGAARAGKEAKSVSPPARFVVDSAGIALDRASIATKVSPQKQGRHVLGAREYGRGRGGSYFDSLDDAQSVLDAFHSGAADIVSVNTRSGLVKVRVPGVTGTNVNVAAGYPSQPTSTFLIKGSSSPSVVPTAP